jgi:hypothetical protein
MAWYIAAPPATAPIMVRRSRRLGADGARSGSCSVSMFPSRALARMGEQPADSERLA